MRVEELVLAFHKIYFCYGHEKLTEIVTEDFSFVSDFDDWGILDADGFQRYLTDLYGYDFTDVRFNRKMIEYVVEQKQDAQHDTPGAVPFPEPRIFQCDLANSKIRHIRQCRLSERKIPADVNRKLLDACQRNDFTAAKQAIADGAYAGNWESGKDCLIAAAKSGDVKLCRLLFADETADAFFKEAIFAAVENPDTGVLSYLIGKGVPLDVISTEDESVYYTPLDHAINCHCQAAEKILRAAGAPTLEKLCQWCMEKSEIDIRISEKGEAYNVSIGTAGKNVGGDGHHPSNSRQWFYMDEYDFFLFIEKMLCPYMTKKYKPYSNDNLIPLPEALKAIAEMEKFCGLLQNDLDDPEVGAVLSRIPPLSYIRCGTNGDDVILTFSNADWVVFWKKHREQLLLFYQEFVVRLKKLVSAARRYRDCYLNIIGP